MSTPQLIDKAAPGQKHVTITGPSVVGAYFAVVVWWNPDMGGFWEPWDTGIGRYRTPAEAYREAKLLGESAGLPVIRHRQYEPAAAAETPQ